MNIFENIVCNFSGYQKSAAMCRRRRRFIVPAKSIKGVLARVFRRVRGKYDRSPARRALFCLDALIDHHVHLRTGNRLLFAVLAIPELMLEEATERFPVSWWPRD